MIDKLLPTKPLTYEIVDLMGEEIEGSFYEQELQKTDQEIFRIEKVLKRDKKKLALVRWSGYPEKFKEWISFDLLNDLEDV